MKRVLLSAAVLVAMACASVSPAQAVWRAGVRGYVPYGGAAYRANYAPYRGYYNGYYGGYGPRAYSYGPGYYGAGVGVGVY